MPETVDDLEAAEDFAAEAARALGNLTADYRDVDALDDAADLVRRWTTYCRPSCGALAVPSRCQVDEDCCGCPCHVEAIEAPRMLKVLTLRQPWASLVALGVKTIETRSWSTKYRGPLAIHAAQKRNVGQVVGPWKVFDAPYEAEHFGTADKLPLPLGAIVATCTLVDVVPMESLSWIKDWRRTIPSEFSGWVYQRVGGDAVNEHLLVHEDQRPYGDFTPGRFAWLLSDIVPVDPPVPFKGGQGLTKTWEPRV